MQRALTDTIPGLTSDYLPTLEAAEREARELWDRREENCTTTREHTHVTGAPAVIEMPNGRVFVQYGVGDYARGGDVIFGKTERRAHYYYSSYINGFRGIGDFFADTDQHTDWELANRAAVLALISGESLSRGESAQVPAERTAGSEEGADAGTQAPAPIRTGPADIGSYATFRRLKQQARQRRRSL